MSYRKCYVSEIRKVRGITKRIVRKQLAENMDLLHNAYAHTTSHIG